MTTRNRPLSPHLQIYRLPLLALMSITHRITGVGLVVGLVALAAWLGAAASGPAAFAVAQSLLGSPIGLLLLFGWSVALFFHLGHGVRHLLWDTGWGFELPQAYASAYVSLGVTAVLTVVAWAAALLV
ncbi:succinate dehydrogenase, cytochrome b556 subunit [Magnetospirillum aberrantis]|uniref:Succinate dehydrogenase cytochrome b556 subunit n=1 Tax=Magnetospirillum aberrantis SpK TaxID=908842 RepID=A0A7C9UWT4_9PROT|nr:succinate dehydrogenase, cytochrome b556 subunit [Magnetospirillum aberrantis]NFV80929.1 succinate dehydrogenase, cytochrome b556 subunit [Magnetospirillum aberrantis SpK]